MTWAKYQPELFVKMAVDGLSQDAALAHLSAIAWLYQQEREDCRFPQRLSVLGIAPLTNDPPAAAAELVRARYWAAHAGEYELIEHADVIRQSLLAQWAKKDRDRKSQQTARDRRSKAVASALTSSPESAERSAPTQASKQPSNHAVAVEEGLGQCRTCLHRELLCPDGRCKSCVEWDVEDDL